MRVLLLTVSIVFSLFWCSVAAADDDPPSAPGDYVCRSCTPLAGTRLATANAGPLTDHQVAALAIPLAHAAFPGSPCASKDRVVLAANRILDALPAPDTQIAAGWAHPQDCTVYIRSGLPRAYLCLVIVHELGHLALGPGHAVSGLMAADASDYPPCDDLISEATRLTRRHASSSRKGRSARGRGSSAASR